jgi:hypothetical protein
MRCLFQDNLLNRHEKGSFLLTALQYPKKWFDPSIVATRLDSNQNTLIINWFYIIAFIGIKLFSAKNPLPERVL